MAPSRSRPRRTMAADASAVRFLDEECRRSRDPQRAAHMGRYFKGVHPFYGIKSPDLRNMIKEVQAMRRKGGAKWTAESLLDTSEALLGAPHGETKMLGAYLLAESSNLKVLREDPMVIEALGGSIERHVRDWATCDALSSQVVRKLIAHNPTYAPRVRSWCESPNGWKQRASCVSFVCLARHGEYNELILDIASHVVRNSERFPQLGVGWVLRELSLTDQPAVVAFVKDHYSEFSREGLRYAIEKMDKPLQKQLLDL
ncbi:hypothetical protein ACHAWF_014955 [Thalassiosira exigua]